MNELREARELLRVSLATVERALTDASDAVTRASFLRVATSLDVALGWIAQAEREIVENALSLGEQ